VSARVPGASAPRAPIIMLVSDRRVRPLEEIWDALPAAARAGLTDLMVREKDMPGGPLLSLAREAVARARPAGVRVVVNDRVDVALAAGADGVHLGVAGLPVAAAKAMAQGRLRVGASTHSIDELLAAQTAGADYATFGPVFPTASKAAYGSPVGVAALRDAARVSAIPVLALGGVTADSAASLHGAGIAGVAAIGALLAAGDLAASVAAMARALRNGE
jgi:thiamine-phosphate pyrophosphorylase